MYIASLSGWSCWTITQRERQVCVFPLPEWPLNSVIAPVSIPLQYLSSSAELVLMLLLPAFDILLGITLVAQVTRRHYCINVKLLPMIILPNWSSDNDGLDWIRPRFFESFKEPSISFSPSISNSSINSHLTAYSFSSKASASDLVDILAFLPDFASTIFQVFTGDCNWSVLSYFPASIEFLTGILVG
jgi:hypothetical protein